MVLTEKSEGSNISIEEKSVPDIAVTEKEDIMISPKDDNMIVSGAAIIPSMTTSTVTTTIANANTVNNEENLDNMFDQLQIVDSSHESPCQSPKIEQPELIFENGFQRAIGADLAHRYESNQTEYSPLPSLIPDYPRKHPLINIWTLWYLESDRTRSWEELQNELTSFNTVEDFWCIYNHIKPASEIKIGSDYSLFKKGIRPMWEDEANVEGGRWMITLGRQYRRAYLDKIWLEVLLCLIGEVFDHSGQVCGAVINLRSKADKISVWTVDGNAQDAILEIGAKLKDYLKFDQEPLTLVYQTHRDNMTKQGSSVRNIYTI